MKTIFTFLLFASLVLIPAHADPSAEAAMLQIIIPSSGGGGVLVPNLAEWYCQDNPSFLILADATGNGHTGTLVGSYGDGVGGVNQAIYTTASGGVVIASTGVATGSTFTMGAWIKFTGTSSYMGILAATVGDNALFLRTISGTTTLDWYDGGDKLDTTALTSGTWYFVAVVQSGGLISFYINGVFSSSVSDSLAPTITFMAKGSGGGEGLIGGSQDVWIDSRAYTAPQLLAKYNAGPTL